MISTKPALLVVFLIRRGEERESMAIPMVICSLFGCLFKGYANNLLIKIVPHCRAYCDHH